MRRLMIVLAASVLLLAGCGGGGGGGGGKPSGPPLTKAQYQAKLKQIAKDVGAQLGTATNSSKKMTKADVDRVVKAVRTFADRLDKVNPPAAIKDLHTRLVAAMREFADEFSSIADKLNNAKDPSAGIAALFGAKSIQELNQLQMDFKTRGYNLNLSG